ncbi:hypothetical protein BOX15_Mlig006602g1, partial [Macrostomum lignano]
NHNTEAAMSTSATAAAAAPTNLQPEQQQQQQLPDPILLAYSMRQEYAAALYHPVPGLYPLPSAVDPRLWYGCLFMRHGPYRGHLVRFCLRVPADYPLPGSACPQLTLAPPAAPFHPRVAPDTGLVELKGFAENWRPGVHRLWQILHHLRRLLARVEVSCSSTEPADIDEAVAKGQFANPEAARLYLSDREAFRHRLESDAAASLQPATDGSGAVDIDCAGGIGELDPSARLWQLAAAENALTDEGDEFQELRSAMFEEAGSRELADAWSVGLWHLGRRPLPRVPSWMDPGSMRILSGDYQ